MHVAVIGAGASGICAARHLTTYHSGFTCVVFEQTDSIGGAWVYSEATGKDKYGLPICSAVYKNLRTNLSKENMQYPGFPFLNGKSFPTSAEVLKYLEDYANHFDLKKYIRFLHHVKSVVPAEKKWSLRSIDLQNNREIVEEFDAIIICNGHYREPYFGHFPDTSKFEGEVLHSHTYRTPEPFADKTILISGAGPSGVDISYDLANFASKIYLSHKTEFNPGTFPENVKQVPQVKSVEKDHVVFADGTTSEYLNTILLCTGYKYHLPFLTPECGVEVVEDKFVQPLYKHIINVNHPTMAFIGLVFRSMLFPLFDYQVRFFLGTLSGQVKLISKEDMLVEIAQELREKQEKGVPLRKYHELGDAMEGYIDTLADLTKIERIPRVIYNIYNETAIFRKNQLSTYREIAFKIIDDNNFALVRKADDNIVELADVN